MFIAADVKNKNEGNWPTLSNRDKVSNADTPHSPLAMSIENAGLSQGRESDSNLETAVFTVEKQEEKPLQEEISKGW